MSLKTKQITLNDRSRTDEIIINFPGGSVAVTRRPDGAGYWAHVSSDKGRFAGESVEVTDAHIRATNGSESKPQAPCLMNPDFRSLAMCFKVTS